MSERFATCALAIEAAVASLVKRPSPMPAAIGSILVHVAPERIRHPVLALVGAPVRDAVYVVDLAVEVPAARLTLKLGELHCAVSFFARRKCDTEHYWVRGVRTPIHGRCSVPPQQWQPPPSGSACAAISTPEAVH